MKKFFALFLAVVMVISMLPTAIAREKSAEKAEEPYVFTDADIQLVRNDVFSSIEMLKAQNAEPMGGVGMLTETDYAAMVPEVMEAVRSSATYAEGTLEQHGSFLYWRTTNGLACCFDPRMEAKLHNTQNMPTAAEIAKVEAEAEAMVVTNTRSGWPGSTDIGLIQPYWESTSNYADYRFNSYSPYYKSTWQSLYAYTGGTGHRHTMSNATVDNIADAIEQCALVIFDSHGTTDYEDYYNDDYTSQANSSYLCLTNNAGITSADTAAHTGPYGTYSNAILDGSGVFVNGDCIAAHMDQNAPHSMVYQGICLGMATDKMFSGLRGKGVEVVYGYSQSVTFAGEKLSIMSIMGFIMQGQTAGEAIENSQIELGCQWDAAYPNYTEAQAKADHVAFPVAVSEEDPYLGQGNVDCVQTVNSTWTLLPGFTVTAYSSDPTLGTVSVSGTTITATPATGCYTAGYEVTAGTATVVMNGNILQVTPETDCTVRVDFGHKNPASVVYHVPEGVSCPAYEGYEGDTVTLAAPTGTPTADGEDYHFLGWVSAQVPDTDVLPENILSAGDQILLNVQQIEYYALYTYFKADNPSLVGQFLRVENGLSSWDGEIVITHAGEQALDASGQHTGTSIGKKIAVVDLAEAGVFVSEDHLDDVGDELVYVVTTDDDGSCRIRMKNKNVWLCLSSNTNSLNTTQSASSKNARWNLSFVDGTIRIQSVSYPDRSLQFNASTTQFLCYKHGEKEPVTIFRHNPGHDRYATELHDKIVCDEHDFTDWTVTVEPTCTEDGMKERHCQVCGYVETETLPALGHEWDDGEVTVPATCAAEGVMTFTCARCGETRTEAVPVDPENHTGNTELRNAKEATCTEDGYTGDTCCADCGAVLQEGEVIPAAGHTPAEAVQENVVAPSCTEDGSCDMVVYCSVCQEELSRETFVTEASGHNWGEWTQETAATCTEDGTEIRTCANCGETETRTLPALGHEWDEGVVTTEPTADSEGVKTFTCIRCGATRTETIPAADPLMPFVDVREKDYFYDPVLWAINHVPVITNGTDDTHFSPNMICAREQVVTFLWRAANCPEPSITENPFKDVKKNAYYYKAVLWAVENEITKGVDATHFGVNQPCTRAQVVTFLWRAEGSPEPQGTVNPFTDVRAKDYFYKAVLWAVENGVTTGTGENMFAPNETCTRAQTVTFLYRAYNN